MSDTKLSPDALIENYVRVRDKKREVETKHKAELAPFNDMLERIEGWMLEALNNAGLSSMKSPHGTAYKSIRTSAKVVDWIETLNFIRETSAWDLLEARVSKLVAEQIMKETGAPIPGVETSRETVVNVRRASATPERAEDACTGS